jgi:hypothetical protein
MKTENKNIKIDLSLGYVTVHFFNESENWKDKKKSYSLHPTHVLIALEEYAKNHFITTAEISVAD